MYRARLDYIQLLRAVAAIAVVMFHAAGATQKYSPFPARSVDFLQFGAYGVDLFFVISGFVIYYTGSDVSPGRFIRKRLERIVPIYWIFTALALPVVLFVTLSGQQFPWSKFVMSLGFVSFLRGEMPLLYVGWSLEYEMFFYLCVALSMFLVRRPWALTCAVLSAAIAVGTVISEPSTATRFWSAPIILEFLMGILIGQATSTKHIGLIEAISVGVASIAVLLIKPDLRPFFAGIPAAMLVAVAVMAGARRLPQWITTLGDASYSIYLIQVFSISACSKSLQVLSPRLDPDLFVILVTLITLAVGVASYHLLELPIRSLLRRRKPSTAPSILVPHS